MSRKQKRKNRPEVGQLFMRARRELDKGNAKIALKDAVLCYRDDASPAHRQFLEQAYVGRVEQLHRKKQPSEARVVLTRLLEFEPTSKVTLEKIPRLQILLGDSRVDANKVFETDPALLIEQADRAVLDSREAVPDFAGSKRHIQQIRAALEAIEGCASKKGASKNGGNGKTEPLAKTDGKTDGKTDSTRDTKAVELLADIPRNSPLCDWKLFVRGLVAFYQSEDKRMQENWRRLDAARPAYRIAQTLLVASGELSKEDAPIDLVSPLRRLELHLQEDSSTGLLKEVAKHWREEDQAGFFRAYRRLSLRFAKTHGSLLEKIVDFVWKRAVRDGDQDALDRLAQIGPAPTLDPNWNRARALMAEHPDQPHSEPVQEYWIAYAGDVEKIASLREDEREIAIGMVYAHLGQCFVEYAEESPDLYCNPGPDYNPRLYSKPDLNNNEPENKEAQGFQLDAIGFFEQSIRRCPQLSETYQGLSMLHEKMGAPEKCATVLQRLLRQDLDHYFAHWWLATYHLGQENPHESEPHVEAVGRLKPRDSQTITLRWNQRVAMTRALTKAKQFEAARQELEQAAQSVPSGIQPYTVDILSAALEFKAKRSELGQQHLDAALTALDEPTAIWMQMSCTAARFGLPREIKKGFDDHFKKAIKKKPTSQTAGRLTEFLIPFRVGDIGFSGRATQERLVTAYLQRAKRVRWVEEDLCQVCFFLELDANPPARQELRERLVKTGLKKFPNSAKLHFIAGSLEMEKGPDHYDIDKTERHFQRVLELAEKSVEPSEQQMVESTKHLLGVLEDSRDRRFPQFLSPFGARFSDDNGEEDEGGYENDDFECDCEQCREMRAEDEAEGRETASEKTDAPRFLKEMKQLLPKPVREKLERAAAKAGKSLDEMLEGLFQQQEQE